MIGCDSLKNQNINKFQNLIRIFTFRVLLVLCSLFLILFGIMFISYCGNEFHWGKASIFGYRVYYVPTESMEPTISKNSFILSKRILPEEVQVGDIIVYERNYCYIVHRVKKIDNETFLLQGDNNKNADPMVQAEQIIGKVIWTLKI